MTIASLRHSVLFYRSDEEFLDVAAPFLRDGVLAGLPVLSVTGRRRALSDRLAGTARFVEFAAPRSLFATPPRALTALLGRSWVLAEPAWTDPVIEWHRFEALVNVALAGSGARVLCAYDTRALDESITATARRTHPHVHGERGVNPGYAEPAAFSAECDETALPPPAGLVLSMTFGDGQLRGVRDFVAGHTKGTGLPAQRAGDFLLAVNEVATNVLRHTGRRGLVRLWTAGDELICEVSDTAGLLVDDLLGRLPPTPGSGRGAGLWMARQLCDLVDLRTTEAGSVVRLHMRL